MSCFIIYRYVYGIFSKISHAYFQLLVNYRFKHKAKHRHHAAAILLSYAVSLNAHVSADSQEIKFIYLLKYVISTRQFIAPTSSNDYFVQNVPRQIIK
jgi:hypothetical protein